MQLQVLSYTSSKFAKIVSSNLGRGERQAKDWYKSFVRFLPTPSSFKNAPQLYQELIQMVDLHLDPIVAVQRDEASGTEKFLLQLKDGLQVESVIIPMKRKMTLCVSSQVGCRMGCAFCQTGKFGLVRNLEAHEIVEQLYLARATLQYPIQNVVFMGMGEPFDTFHEVMKAYEIMTDPDGFEIGRKNITISTAGHAEGICRLARYEGQAPNLAVSLHAADDTLRSSLMPINRRFPLSSLKEALSLFVSLQKREILIVYLLLDGVNDTEKHAADLMRYVEGLPVKINLTSYNDKPGSTFSPSSPEIMDRFASYLRRAGYQVLMRSSKGQSIQAACGQLAPQRQATVRT